MSGSPIALRVGMVALLAMIALQLIWHAWLFPSQDHEPSMLVLTVGPMLLSLWTGWGNPRRGVLVGGIFCLAYFAHGVTSAYSEPASRFLALLEIALTLVIIGASGWDARGYRRRK